MKSIRIWFACATGMALSMAFDFSYGFFVIIAPAYVLNLTEERNLPAMIVAALGGFVASLESTLIVELLQSQVALMMIATGIFLLSKCIMMMYQSTALFGFAGLLIGSMILSMASYETFDVVDFNANLWVCLVSSIAIYAFAFFLFPNKEQPPAPEQKPLRSHQDKRNQVTMGVTITFLVFLVFQVFDLYDSLAALVSVIIILAPMTLNGAIAMGKLRLIGTFLGCLAGLVLQLGLGSWYSHPILFWLAFTIVSGALSWLFSKGQIGAGIGFSALAALSVPLTTTLVPQQQDAVFAIVYRFSSIFVAVVAALVIVSAMHHLQTRASVMINTKAGDVS